MLWDGETDFTPAYPVKCVDTTGAGDCFNAGFLHGWLQSRPLRDALQLGVACGSFSIRALGGTGAQATEAEAMALLDAAGALKEGARQ